MVSFMMLNTCCLQMWWTVGYKKGLLIQSGENFFRKTKI